MTGLENALDLIDPRDALSRAIRGGDKATLRELLKDKRLLEAPDPRQGRTPLYEAVQCERREVVRMLVDRGARLHASQDNVGILAPQTPWELALAGSQWLIIDTMLRSTTLGEDDLRQCAVDLATRTEPIAQNLFARIVDRQQKAAPPQSLQAPPPPPRRHVR